MVDARLPASALLRLRGPSGRTVGTGFLVAPDLVATCAHVVAAALGRAGAEPPAGALTVEFPLVDGEAGAARQAVVVGWQPMRADGSGDTAVLRLDRPAPSGTRPARLTLAEPVWGDQIRVFGFPADLREEYGVWVEAELRARQGAGWLQLESPPHRRGIGPGFSGSPVWNPASGGVVGMVVAAEQGTGGSTTSYVIPSRALVDAHPEIAAPDPAETCPYRGLAPFLEEHAAHFRGREPLVDRVLEQLRHQPLVTLAGPSGSGKSSLVYAGLIPRLRERGTLVAGFRPLPGVRPTALLAGAVIGVLEPGLGELRRHEEATALADRLDAAPADTLPWLAGRLVERAGEGGLLIFGDQFEEMPTGAARELWRLLHRLVRVAPRGPDGSAGVLVALTMRSGALDDLVTDDTAAAATDGVVFVPPMSREQLRAAVTAADVDFEPGLVDTILDAAGTEPGHLPLVEFTLARLWERRTAGLLTHRAYQELGGVSGALARYAGQVYRQLPESRRAAARRLLVQLARPEADGGFLRRPVRLARLGDDELREVLPPLVASRLVVVGRATDGAEIADLAHQALVRHWADLRDWLVAERDFRTWQEELRADLARWEAAGRDPGGLLRGVALATAERWRRAHPQDISPAEHAYLRSSRAREQRRIRTLWSVVAVISVLALTATGLAVVAARQTAQADARLRTAASRALADDANRTRRADPRMSLQLAQAAWHHDRSAEAYGALFSWYAAVQSVDVVYQDMWNEDLRRIAASQDGSVVVFENAFGRPAVWTGMTGARPEEWLLPTGGREDFGGTYTVSPSGTLLAYANSWGSVLLWNVERRSGPVVLTDRPLSLDPAVQFTGTSVTFSPEGSRVMVRWTYPDGTGSVIGVWEVAGGAPVELVGPVGPRERVQQVSFGPGPDSVLVSAAGSARLHDLRTGRLLRSFPAGDSSPHAIVRSGAALARCVDGRLRVLDTATGRPVATTRLAVPCSTRLSMDVGSDHAVFASPPGDAGSTADLTIVDLRDGRAYQSPAPPVDLDVAGGPGRITVVPGSEGRPAALVAGKNLGYRLRAAEPVPAPGPAAPGTRPPGSVRMTSPYGRYELTIDGDTGRMDLLNLTTRARVGSAPGPPPATITKVRYTGLWMAFSPDNRRLAAVHGGSLVVYTLPGFTVERRLALPGGGPVPPAFALDAWASSVLFDTDGRVIVLHAGLLTRWDLTDGRRTDEPLPVSTDPERLQRSALLAYLARQPRPGRTGEVAVVQPLGDVEVWSIDRREPVVEIAPNAAPAIQSVVFHPDGSRVAVQSADGEVSVWDVDSGRRRGRSIPTGAIRGVLGFTDDSGLVTVSAAEGKGIQLWDERSGKLLATLAIARPDANPLWVLNGDTLSIVEDGRVRRLPLAPDEWFSRLCELSDRPYTPDEKEVLRQHNGSTEAPCP